LTRSCLEKENKLAFPAEERKGSKLERRQDTKTLPRLEVEKKSVEPPIIECVPKQARAHPACNLGVVGGKKEEGKRVVYDRSKRASSRKRLNTLNASADWFNVARTSQHSRHWRNGAPPANGNVTE
jgi:hypothetical protein